MSCSCKKIKSEITASDFIAIQVAETIDSSTETLMVLIFTFVFDGLIYQRFLVLLIPVGLWV